jgi:hypothetical protein
VPLAWYPRLLYGKLEERSNWHLLGNREGIHWPELDEDISVENLLFGKPSGDESQRSFKEGNLFSTTRPERRWLAHR